jgi:hypothetical protein
MLAVNLALRSPRPTSGLGEGQGEGLCVECSTAAHPPRSAWRPLPGGERREVVAAAAVALWLGSGGACVDSKGATDASTSNVSDGAVAAATCELPTTVPVAIDAGIPSEDQAISGPYAWKNVVIKGGGFVSGIVTSPALSGLVFARTDVGGAYRFNPAAQRWMPMTDWVGHDNSNLIGIESIAADPVDPNRVYLAAGEYLTAGNGAILSSTDMGQTWAKSNIPAPMGGNVDGRSMGERLAIDPNLTSTLYFGSRNAGLWTSTDFARTWTQVTGFPTIGATNGGAGSGSSTGTGYGLTFVVFDPKSGVPGSPTPAIYVGVGVLDGTALYRSLDAGSTWEAVAGQPTGKMPHHAVLDGCGNLYLTYNNGSGPGNITSGAVWRYDSVGGVWTEVSPPHLGGGFGGISADAAHPGTLIVTTIDFWSPGEIFRTTNGGAIWVALVSKAQRDVAGAVWLWWHSSNLPTMGWMGDVEIDPFNPGHVLYITGQGIWSSNDVTAADTSAPTHWSFADDGLEETVVLDLASPPVGAPLLSGVGDIGGFRHDDLDISPPGGFFDNPKFGNTTSLDFAELAPAIVARVGTSSGGQSGAHSTDGGTTWTPFATAPAGSKGSGSIAVSADGATLVWAPQGATPAYSLDSGTTWTPCGAIAAGAKVAADRVQSSKFYASDRTGMYVSTDGGVNFVKVAASPAGRPRPVFGSEGDVWVATSTGLFHSQDSATTFVQLPQVSGATAVGFGMPAPGQSYPAVYLAGSVSGVWGTYRSDDAGSSWQRIDDSQHQFGYINCLTGDPRRYGRVYLGTGGRGILYGDPR